MHLRPLRLRFSALAFAAVLLGAASSAFAGPKDKEAQKLFDSAINEDYLNAEFPKAEKKLKEAVEKCGSSGCSPELLGKINIALGTVYGVGLSKSAEAKAAFVVALKADPKAALDPSLTTPELTKLFDEAKKSAGSSAAKPAGPAPAGDAQHTPPPESPVNTPLPLYVEPTEEVPLAKVTLRYKPFGAKEYKSVELKKVGKGYGGEVPCDDVTTTGDIKYFFAFTGADGEAAGGLGSTKEPFRTTVKNEIEGESPKLPGKKAPAQCKAKEDCPPGLPGCEAKGGAAGKRGDKGWGSSCEETKECKAGLMCLNGTCEEDKGGGGGAGSDGPKKRMNMVSVGLQLDLLFLGSATDVCSLDSEAANNHACFYRGSNRQFFGSPVKAGNTTGVQGGAGYGDIRILASYDRQFVKSLGLSAGVRVGFAIGGSPTPDAGKIPNGYNPALSFLPLHAEIRASYHIMGSMMDEKKLRPYVFVVPFGFAQVNASVPVTVCDSKLEANETPSKACGGNNILRELDTYQITGRNFSGFGAGTTFGITPYFGIYAEAKMMFMWPTFGVVLSPTLGPAFTF